MTNAPKIFKPEDFPGIDAFAMREALAATANELFAQWLEQQQVVYGSVETGWAGKPILSDDTHTARLVCVEPIKKCERHEPAAFQDTPHDGRRIDGFFCKHCNVKLVAEWKEA